MLDEGGANALYLLIEKTYIAVNLISDVLGVIVKVNVQHSCKM